MTLPMTRDLSRYGIRVVSIAPSPFKSPMEAMMSEKVRKGLLAATEFPRRAGDPPEFAGLVKHAIENSMLNGSTIRIDGGMRLPSKIQGAAQLDIAKTPATQPEVRNGAPQGRRPGRLPGCLGAGLRGAGPRLLRGHHIPRHPPALRPPVHQHGRARGPGAAPAPL
ncbi:hypothetical protein VUR80DRAFT_1010 [Thermomyces stellatus]